MKCITFGKIDKKLLIPLIGGLITLSFKSTAKYNPKYKIATQNHFLYSMYVSISMILAIIPHLILKQRSKSSLNSSDTPKEQSKLNIKFIVDKDIFVRKKSAKFRFIFYSTVFDFSQTLLYTLFALNNSFNLWNFDIIFLSLFSYLLLKTKFYRHQYFSMIFITILGLGLNINEFFKNDKEYTSGLFEITMIFISEISFCLNVGIAKYNMEKNFCGPYEVCMWEGAIEFILNLICLIIFNLSGSTINGVKYPDNIKEYFGNYDYNDFIICFTSIIAHFFLNTSLFLTCHYFTPFHSLNIFIIKDSYLYLRHSENKLLNILSFIIIILIVFVFLVFNEIIEINICNISFNTKKNIEKRSNKESLIEFMPILPSNVDEKKTDEDDKNDTTL